VSENKGEDWENKREQNSHEDYDGNGKKTTEGEDKEITEKTNEEGENNLPENDENSGAEENSEEATDSAIAWEVLELARRILSTQTDSKSQRLLSDVYSTLGHLQEEQGNVDGAISEYEKSLVIRTTQFPDKDRSLAEAHYALGVALCGIQSRFEEALKHLEESKCILHFHTIKNTDPEIIKQLSDAVQDIDARIDELKTKPDTIENSIATDTSGGIHFTLGNAPTVTTPIINLGVIGGRQTRPGDVSINLGVIGGGQTRPGDVSTGTTNTTLTVPTTSEGQNEENKKRKYSETLGNEKESDEPEHKKQKK